MLFTKKQPSNHRLIFKKALKVVKFNQEAWLKVYIDMNSELKNKSKKYCEKFFFKINENCKFWKKHGKCEKTLNHKNFNNRTTKKIFSIRIRLSNKTIFSEKLLAIEMKKPQKTEIITNQPVYLG